MAVWQMLFCLTAFAFLCRAVIPVGYMPDLSGQRDTTFAITLCSMGGGTSVMLVDFSDDAAHPGGKAAPDDAYSGESCPLGLNLAQQLLPGHDAPVLQGSVSFRPIAAALSSQALPPMPALGPPLGSRAPPSLLG